MYLDIGLRRGIVDVFISNLTPLVVVVLMLYALLVLSGRMDDGRALSIVFSHIDIRRKIAAEEIFYLEYFTSTS